MKKYLKSRLVIIGLILLVVGSGPLLTIIALAKLGITSDPDPNPLFFGMLCGVTFWPGLILLGVGIWETRRKKDFL